MNKGIVRAGLLVCLAAVRCASSSGGGGEAGGDAQACLPAGGMPPDASLCVPGQEPCCAPATCTAVPGGFACLVK